MFKCVTVLYPMGALDLANANSQESEGTLSKLLSANTKGTFRKSEIPLVYSTLANEHAMLNYSTL